MVQPPSQRVPFRLPSQDLREAGLGPLKPLLRNSPWLVIAAGIKLSPESGLRISPSSHAAFLPAPTSLFRSWRCRVFHFAAESPPGFPLPASAPREGPPRRPAGVLPPLLLRQPRAPAAAALSPGWRRAPRCAARLSPPPRRSARGPGSVSRFPRPDGPGTDAPRREGWPAPRPRAPAALSPGPPRLRLQPRAPRAEAALG